MNQTSPIQSHSWGRTTVFRRADQPFFLPLDDYHLSPETLKEKADRRTAPKVDWWIRYTLRFQSFAGGRLVMTTEDDGKTYTMVLLVEEGGLTATCSCGRRVARLCDHLYHFLHISTYSTSLACFDAFRPGGRMEMAVAHPQQFDISAQGHFGIYTQLKKGLGWVYHLEREIKPLFPYLHLPVKEPSSPVPETMCYFLMMSPKEERAPFILPCPGILSENGKTVKRFGDFVPGLDISTHRAVLSEEILRLRACEAILYASEGLSGIACAEDGETVQRLAALFALYQSYLPRFRDARLYLHLWYGKKYIGSKPNRNYAYPVRIETSVVSLQFSLHRAKGVYNLRVKLLVEGRHVMGYSLAASFFLANGDWTVVYLFASLRDAGLVYWMEQNGWVVTVFEEHFARFEREVLGEIEKHYVVKRTGRYV